MKYLIPALALSLITLAGSVSADCDRKKYDTIVEPEIVQGDDRICKF